MPNDYTQRILRFYETRVYVYRWEKYSGASNKTFAKHATAAAVGAAALLYGADKPEVPQCSNRLN